MSIPSREDAAAAMARLEAAAAASRAAALARLSGDPRCVWGAEHLYSTGPCLLEFYNNAKGEPRGYVSWPDERDTLSVCVVSAGDYGLPPGGNAVVITRRPVGITACLKCGAYSGDPCSECGQRNPTLLRCASPACPARDLLMHHSYFGGERERKAVFAARWHFHGPQCAASFAMAPVDYTLHVWACFESDKKAVEYECSSAACGRSTGLSLPFRGSLASTVGDVRAFVAASSAPASAPDQWVVACAQGRLVGRMVDVESVDDKLLVDLCSQELRHLCVFSRAEHEAIQKLSPEFFNDLGKRYTFAVPAEGVQRVAEAIQAPGAGLPRPTLMPIKIRVPAAAAAWPSDADVQRVIDVVRPWRATMDETEARLLLGMPSNVADILPPATDAESVRFMSIVVNASEHTTLVHGNDVPADAMIARTASGSSWRVIVPAGGSDEQVCETIKCIGYEACVRSRPTHWARDVGARWLALRDPQAKRRAAREWPTAEQLAAVMDTYGVDKEQARRLIGPDPKDHRDFKFLAPFNAPQDPRYVTIVVYANERDKLVREYGVDAGTMCQLKDRTLSRVILYAGTADDEADETLRRVAMDMDGTRSRPDGWMDAVVERWDAFRHARDAAADDEPVPAAAMADTPIADKTLQMRSMFKSKKHRSDDDDDDGEARAMEVADDDEDEEDEDEDEAKKDKGGEDEGGEDDDEEEEEYAAPKARATGKRRKRSRAAAAATGKPRPPSDHKRVPAHERPIAQELVALSAQTGPALVKRQLQKTVHELSASSNCTTAVVLANSGSSRAPAPAPGQQLFVLAALERDQARRVRERFPAARITQSPLSNRDNRVALLVSTMPSDGGDRDAMTAERDSLRSALAEKLRASDMETFCTWLCDFHGVTAAPPPQPSVREQVAAELMELSARSGPPATMSKLNKALGELPRYGCRALQLEATDGEQQLFVLIALTHDQARAVRARVPTARIAATVTSEGTRVLLVATTTTATTDKAALLRARDKMRDDLGIMVHMSHDVEAFCARLATYCAPVTFDNSQGMAGLDEPDDNDVEAASSPVAKGFPFPPLAKAFGGDSNFVIDDDSEFHRHTRRSMGLEEL